MEPFKLPPFFYEIFHASLPRLGPGDDASTARALATARNGLADGPLRILDLGCGNGPQTLRLAELADGPITAVDNHEPFLVELRRRAEAAGVDDRINAVNGDMGAPDPAWGPCDLIWSEGAIFVTGVENGLKTWRPLLAPGGRLAFTELVWFENDPPAECHEFLMGHYPAMASVEAVRSVIADCGYAVLDHFRLPETAWREGFYDHLAMHVENVRARPGLGPDELGMLDGAAQEIANYDAYSRWFGYEFFVLEAGD